MEWRVWSVKCGGWECEVWNVWNVWGVECKAWSVNVECKV